MQRNARGTYERMQIAREMKGNARGRYGSGYKVPGEWRGMQGNARETYGSGCIVPGECKGVGVKC